MIFSMQDEEAAIEVSDPVAPQSRLIETSAAHRGGWVVSYGWQVAVATEITQRFTARLWTKGISWSTSAHTPQVRAD